MKKQIIPSDLNPGDLIIPKFGVKDQKWQRFKFLNSKQEGSYLMGFMIYEFSVESEYLKNDFNESRIQYLVHKQLEFDFELWSYEDLELVKYIEKLQFDDSVIFNDDISKLDLLDLILKKAKEL